MVNNYNKKIVNKLTLMKRSRKKLFIYLSQEHLCHVGFQVVVNYFEIHIA